MSTKFIEAHIIGSSLVHGVRANDIDIMVLFENTTHMNVFMEDKESCNVSDYPDQGAWTACRCGDKNYICTCSPEVYYRMKAFSTALRVLQLKEKDDRTAFCRACRDHEPEYVHEI